LLGVTGCGSLHPVVLPDEVTPAPADSHLWAALEAARPGNWFELLNDGPRALAWRLRSIASATESLDLQTFLWKEDRVGLQLFGAVLDAADRGVRTRLLLDDTFTIGENDLLFDLDQHPRIDVRIYNPFRHRHGGMMLRELLNAGEFGRLDHRMHNKVLVVDNRAAIVGGRNLANEYFGHHEVANFRDMETLCAGPVVREISRCFDEFWNSDWSFPVSTVLSKPGPEKDLPHLRQWLSTAAAPAEDAVVAREQWIEVATGAAGGDAVIFADAPARANPADRREAPEQLAKAVFAEIDRAQSELILVSAYLIPTPEFEALVERAEARGVEVHILTNSLRSNNHVAAHSAYRHHVHRLVHQGADLHEVRSQAKDRSRYMLAPVAEKKLGLHAKLILIDNQYAFIGSANLDPRSLRLNSEMGLMIDSPSLNRRLRDLLALDFHPRNAWHLRLSEQGDLNWVADDVVLDGQPSDSAFQNLEDWFLSLLPIEGKM
jgi:putative cardiolipin synthase